MSFVSRGFRGRKRDDDADPARVPPGQYVTNDFPVLSAGPTPHTPLEQWTFSIVKGDEKKSWTWEELRALPSETVTVDIHCVTRWSKLDTTWEGVSVDTLLDGVEHDSPYVLAFCDGGYTTNLPLEDVTGGKAWVAFGYDGEPLDPEHGGPARLLVPHLYFWKSAKWVRGRLTWQIATVGTVVDETARVRTLELDVPDWAGHRAGQHLDVRLTAEDGYRAERSYSIASAPGEPVAITVERLDDGEVSPYLTEELRTGDELELRGPIGGYFVWEPRHGGPLLLVAGGSGIVPLRAILREHRRSGSDVPVRLLYSSRSLADVIYRAELEEPAPSVEVAQTLTRSQPDGWTGYARRVDAALLGEVAWPAGENPLAFVCGPTSFVETVAGGLVGLGYPPARVKTERFGATGGR